jgi:hypothetical protein
LPLTSCANSPPPLSAHVKLSNCRMPKMVAMAHFMPFCGPHTEGLISRAIENSKEQARGWQYKHETPYLCLCRRPYKEEV